MTKLCSYIVYISADIYLQDELYLIDTQKMSILGHP